MLNVKNVQEDFEDVRDLVKKVTKLISASQYNNYKLIELIEQSGVDYTKSYFLVDKLVTAHNEIENHASVVEILNDYINSVALSSEELIHLLQFLIDSSYELCRYSEDLGNIEEIKYRARRYLDRLINNKNMFSFEGGLEYFAYFAYFYSRFNRTTKLINEIYDIVAAYPYSEFSIEIDLQTTLFEVELMEEEESYKDAIQRLSDTVDYINELEVNLSTKEEYLNEFLARIEELKSKIA